MRKCIRWYHKVATEIISNTFVVNTQNMNNEQNFRNKLNIHKFCDVLIDKLLKLKPASLHVSKNEQPLDDKFQRRQNSKA